MKNNEFSCEACKRILMPSEEMCKYCKQPEFEKAELETYCISCGKGMSCFSVDDKRVLCKECKKAIEWAKGQMLKEEKQYDRTI